MIDWRSSMTQTYEFYKVDPDTWKDKEQIFSITSTNISRDLESNTLETASFVSTEIFGECYIRVYMVVIQNGIKERVPLGTFMTQTPSSSFNGKVKSVTMDAYSSLLELSDVQPPLGFTVMKNQNIMDNVCDLTEENLRAPIVRISGVEDILPMDFTAEADETWLDYISSLMAYSKYYYMLDEMGRVLFAPSQSIGSLQPVWTYDDDNSSILYPDIYDDFDLYGIPNFVEVIYSGQDEVGNPLTLYATAINDNPNSPVSTVSRGRKVVHRDTNPSINGIPDQVYLNMYAEQLLDSLSSVQHTISYSHGYCPVRYGDCVCLNYERAGIKNVKAKVIRQDIDCVSGCKVTETAVYTTNLWKEE